jgi:hypothetical protein
MRLTMGQKQLESNPFPARSAAGPHAMGGIAATACKLPAHDIRMCSASAILEISRKLLL